MERNTVHSPRVDDEMAEEIAAEEEPEPEAEPVVAAIGHATDALDADEVRRRSELAAALPGHAFPGDRGQLRHAAEAEHAPEWVIDALGTLPIDTRFDTPQDVWSALGGHRESRDVTPDPEPAPAPAPVEQHAEHTEPAPPSPSPPPALDLVARVAGIAGVGVGLASAVIGGTLNLARRVLGSLRR
jgi:hypothetical protein